ncbi:MAG TPA: type IV secretion system protein [Methylibium sp.]|uniref:type IV secretion system protein n=1 Tax=Methylibium sp. TaxID=2067992 RepID=UPI002DBF4805|nr:type IV secretion system protein [Methylibium sp.]HEU4458819.1 type IV secretion system protein [Methylibium sp.]
MGFFAQFFTWLQGQLAAYVGTNAAVVAAAIEPAAFTLGTCYVMMWGFLQLSGRVQEPMWEGVKRMLVLVLIFGIALRLWLYNAVVVDTFANGPSQLAAAILGASSPVALVDRIWSDGNKVAQALTAQGGLTDVSFLLAAAAVYVLVGLLCVAVAALLAISQIAVAILLALGPLFIVMLLFDSTKRFFEQWMGLLTNYALITVLIALIAAMLLGVVRAHAAEAVASGAAVTIAEAARLCVVCVLVALLVKQVPSMAAGLAAGVALSTYSAVSRGVSWGLGAARSTGYQGMRGVMDGLRGEPTSRWDSLRRSGGNLIGSGVRRLLGGSARAEGGTLVPRDRAMPPPHRR